ncbi:MAG: hypothetical protein M1827_004507 [Pycnora praestabilis]|nr:MAG: hypothetical protein M1827_004507 [Pycnora praestabilis]
MAQASNEQHELLRRPLYVFDLPREIVVTLQRKDDPSSQPVPDAEVLRVYSHEDLKSRKDKDGTAGGSMSCALCALTFPTVEDQRGHVRSDLHGYNLKRKLKGLDPVAEAEFEKLVGDLDESISGSDSSDSEGSENEGAHVNKAKDTTLSALLKKQANILNKTSVDDITPKKPKRGSGKPPLIWFKSLVLPSDTSLGIYRAIFTDAEQEEESHIIDTVRNKQLSLLPTPKPPPIDASNGVPLPLAMTSPHVFLCMIGGGHFAAMIVSLAPKMGKKAAGGDERQATVIAHKTFHRYTTRRKQGGAQSANDSAKGAAHSAGSSLRRYNEGALTAEIRQLLGDWRELIDNSQLLFMRATGSTNRRTLYGPYDGQVLRQNDPRIRGFPFSTRRATQAELMRAFVELTRVKVSQVDEAALAAAAAAAAESERASAFGKLSKGTSEPVTPEISKEEEMALLHTSQLQSLIRRSKAPGVLSYLSSHSISPNFMFHPPHTQQNHHTPTPLHLAASINSPAVVLALLTKAGADPTVTNGEDKTAFDLAGERSTRDTFRVARHDLGEAQWSWEAAHIPGPLSRADADKREERDRKEAEKKETDRRRAETERLKREGPKESLGQSGKGGKPLGLTEKTAAEKREEEARGMTPEMRMRLERERRARAAEERMRRMQSGAGAGR